jgi:methionine-rich copper-binding protein CopC
MHRTIRVARLFVAVAAIGAISAAAAPVARFHTKLLKSSPSAHDTLAASPKSVSLWFSERVELPMTAVKLAGSADGRYTISYTVAGKDGHPAKGTIDFVVKSKR